MRLFLILMLAITCAGCATTQHRSACATAAVSREYDAVQLAPTAGGLQPMAPAQVRHAVKPGETLWSIAKAYHVDLDDLARANSIRDTGAIEKGQILVIPMASVGRSAVRSTQKPTYVAARSPVSFIWPVRGSVVAAFGSTADKVVNKGIDISAAEGTSVVAARAGKIVFCDDYLKGFGKTVIIDHADGYQTVYSYNADIVVKVGDTVRQRDVIAKVGSSGRAREPMLHFEIRKNGEPQDPQRYLSR